MRKRVLITDVDNTLFDWVEFWGVAFSAMMKRIGQIEDIDVESLYPEIKAIHERHGTSEYAYMLEELAHARSWPAARSLEIVEQGNRAFAEARDAQPRLYPDVLKTLAELKSAGTLIVAYTESFARYTGYRFKQLGLDGVVDYLYSPGDHETPDTDLSHFSHTPPGSGTLALTCQRFTPKGEIKPNPHILQTICDECSIEIDEAAYVGDSLMKDIAMAQQVGMLDVHAAYGGAQHRAEYELLKKVTHWPDKSVRTEASINADQSVKPSIVLESSFAELRRLFQE